jgi:hypothetical protein
MKKVAIIQSNYIPWKGYFDIIAAVDEFILYDDTQYTRRDWRNRNQIKTPQGLQWMTVPVEVKGKQDQKICETRVGGQEWRRVHWQSLRHNYGKAPHFSMYAGLFEKLYLDANEVMLSKINYGFISTVCGLLGIDTRLTWSMDYAAHGSKAERLISLCEASGATHYLSGPSARDYIDPAVFSNAGIELEYMDYAGYPAYPQLHGEFEHGVTILDLIFNTGADAPRFMKFTKVPAS